MLGIRLLRDFQAEISGGCLIAIVVMVLLFGCKSHKDEFYYDRSYVVVKTGVSDDLTHDKFHTPVSKKLLLARSTVDSTMFIEWDLSQDIAAFYNKKIGDTLHFKYIRKYHEFKIH